MFHRTCLLNIYNGLRIICMEGGVCDCLGGASTKVLVASLPSASEAKDFFLESAFGYQHAPIKFVLGLRPHPCCWHWPIPLPPHCISPRCVKWCYIRSASHYSRNEENGLMPSLAIAA